MDTTEVDLLQIKIDKAKSELSEESAKAIDAVDWKTIVLGMRAEKGYSYTQLEDLELETELLLCGLINPEDYPKELERRLGLPRPKVDELVNEINEKVFKRIREELVKNIERKGTEQKPPISPLSRGQKMQISPDKGRQEGLDLESREDILKVIENTKTPDLTAQEELPAASAEELSEKNSKIPAVEKKIPSILSQKLSGSFKIPSVQTEHTLNNLSKNVSENKTQTLKTDPYREIQE